MAENPTETSEAVEFAAMDPNETLQLIGTGFNLAIGQVPVVGSAVKPLFEFLWNRMSEEAKIGMQGLVASVKAYVDERLQYAKEQNIREAIGHFNSVSNDLQIQIGISPPAGETVRRTHGKCVERARDALDVLYDKEWAHITFQNYATMSTMYLALLDDGIKDINKWGFSTAEKATYSDRKARFFNSTEFSDLLGLGMDKMPKSLPMKQLALSTAPCTQFWYCLDERLYPIGKPEVIAPLGPTDVTPTNTTRHVHFQPPDGPRSPVVVNNIPCGRVLMTETEPQTTIWHHFYPNRSNINVLRLVNPSGTYPATVSVRYYRLITTTYGMNLEIKVTLSPGSSYTYPIPSGNTTPGVTQNELIRTEAVMIWTNPLSYNDNSRGVGADAKVAYVELGRFSLSQPANVSIQWRKTEYNPEPVYVCPLELLVG